MVELIEKLRVVVHWERITPFFVCTSLESHEVVTVVIITGNSSEDLSYIIL